MTDREFVDFSETVKHELQKIYDQKAFDPLLAVIDKKFTHSRVSDNTFELHIYSQLRVKNDVERMLPLCLIAPSQTPQGDYVGVHFGIVPKLPSAIRLKLEVVKE